MHQQRLSASLPKFFIGIVTILLIIGSLFVYSASCIFALEMYNNPHFFFKRHIFGIIIGLATIALTQLIPISFIKKFSLPFLYTTLFLTGLSLTQSFGVFINGSSRWIKIGNFSFQPSELLKIALIFYISKILSQKRLTSYDYLLCIISVFLSSFLLLKQPDFGMTVTIAITLLLLFFVTHARFVSFVFIILSIVFGSIFLITMQPYRIQRILTFLDPWHDPQGKGFQIIQSFIAIGCGGVYGNGIGHSQQKLFYLPMQHTDFIFPIIAEETGFIGALIVILLYLSFLLYGIKIVKTISDSFCALASFSFIMVIEIQALINIAVATGLAPTKGIGLPFISYGNTNLVCTLFMIGFILKSLRIDYRMKRN
jgi:cell division protein FtsW